MRLFPEAMIRIDEEPLASAQANYELVRRALSHCGTNSDVLPLVKAERRLVLLGKINIPLPGRRHSFS